MSDSLSVDAVVQDRDYKSIEGIVGVEDAIKLQKQLQIRKQKGYEILDLHKLLLESIVKNLNRLSLTYNHHLISILLNSNY